MFKNVVVWISDKVLLFVLLIFVLLLAPSVRQAIEVVSGFDRDKIFASISKSHSETFKELKIRDRKSVERALSALNDRLNEIDQELNILDQTKCFLPTCDLVVKAQRYPLELEKALIDSAIKFGKHEIKVKSVCDNAGIQLEYLEDLLNICQESPRLEVCRKIPAQSELVSRLGQECKALMAVSRSFNEMQQDAKNKIETSQKLLLDRIEFWQAAANDWFAAAQVVAPHAFLVLLAITISPIVTKLFTFYLIAPLAARQPGIVIDKIAGYDVKLDGVSGPLLDVSISPDSELLIKPEFIRAKPNSVEEGSRVVFDSAMPISSVASGLLTLTRFTTKAASSVVTLAGNTGNTKLAMLVVPDQAVVVLKPHYLIGVKKQLGKASAINRYWRIWNLSSWLTLQFRYIAFHGPVTLILIGEKGVDVNTVDSPVALDQSVTIGFTANLQYSVTNAKSLLPYLRGSRSLFDDQFSGGPGFYIQEVAPRGRAGTLPGRFLEWILDIFRRILGL